MESNIYIKALDIGMKNPNGIKYQKVVEAIADVINENLNTQAEYNFIEWLVDNFHNSELKSDNLKIKFLGNARAVLSEQEVAKTYHQGYDNVMNHPWLLKGKAIKQYLDYLELKESREQAAKANRRAMYSIAIALLSLAFSILFSVLSPKPPMPPYDVRVLETNQPNNTESKLVIDSIVNDRVNKEEESIKKVPTKVNTTIDSMKLDSNKIINQKKHEKKSN
nr:hypothetical protein [uncultured Allomuricauda sp.]